MGLNIFGGLPIFENGFDQSQASCLIAGIPCSEYVRDYYESADRSSGPDCSKTYLCDWRNRFLVANACLGLARVTARNGAVTFLPPLQHPEIASAFCGSLRITGKGKPFGAAAQIAWPVAAITVGFKAYPWNFQGTLNQDPEGLMNIDPATSFVYATQDIDQGEETLEFPPGSLQYGTPPATVGGRAGLLLLSPQNSRSIPISHAVMRITFNKLPYMPVDTLPVYNNVNLKTFLGCAPGTVKFKGSSTHREYQSDGSITQSVVNTYNYRPSKDWNYVPNPIKGADPWALITRSDANLSYIFPYSDLSLTIPNGYSS